MKRLLLFSLIVGLAFNLFGQNEPPLATDRPGLSYSATVVPAQYLQLESTFTSVFSGLNNTSSNQQFGHLFQLRYGVAKRLEISSDINYGFSRFIAPEVETQSESAVYAWRIAARYQVLKESKWLPELSAGLFYHPPVGDDLKALEGALPEAMITANKTFFDKLSVNPSMLVFYREVDKAPDFITTLNIAYSLNDKWGVFVGTAYQKQGVFRRSLAPEGAIYLEAGGTYLLSNQIQLDFDFGSASVRDNWDSFYANAGFSWRFSVAH